MASISCPTLEQEIVRFIVPHRYAILSALGRKNAAPVNPSRGDSLAHDLTDRGLNVRDWLYVEDNCRAINAVLRKGAPGTTYNVGGGNELSNIDLIHLLLHALAAQTGKPEENYTKLITFVPDRPGHDRRYALDSRKLHDQLGWVASTPAKESLVQSVGWLRGSW